MPVVQNAGSADKQNSDCAGISHELHDTHIQSDEAQSGISDAFHFFVDCCELFNLIIFLGVCSDKLHGSQRFLRRSVDAVQSSLQLIELLS